MACRRPSLRFRPPARRWVRPPAPCRGLHQLLHRSFPIPSAYALSPVRLPPAADRAATSCKILPVPCAPPAAGCAAAFQNPVSANARAVSPRARPRGGGSSVVASVFSLPSVYALSPVRLPPAADRAATSCKILPVPCAPPAAGCAAAFQNPVSANARAVSPRARPRGRFLIHPRRAGFFRLRRVGMAAGFACVPPARGFPRIASIMVHGSGLLRCAGARPCQRVRRRFGISSVRAAAAHPGPRAAAAHPSPRAAAAKAA